MGDRPGCVCATTGVGRGVGAAIAAQFIVEGGQVAILGNTLDG